MKKLLFGLLGLLFSISANAACNLFDINSVPIVSTGYNYTINNNSLVVTARSGTAEASRVSFFVDAKKFKENTTYYFYSKSDKSFTQTRLNIGKATPNNSSDNNAYGTLSSKIDNGYAGVFTITTIDPDQEYVSFFYYLGEQPQGTEITISDIMITEGDTATAYEPYNPLCATCDGEIKNSLNLFNSTQYDQYKQADGTYRASAQTFINIQINATSDMIGKTYTFSAFFDLTKEDAPTYMSVLSHIDGVAKIGDKIYEGQTGYSNITFTPTSTNDYFGMTYGSNGNRYVTVSEIQLEQGSERTTYHPYGSYCQQAIKVATTKYVETQFSGLSASLAAAVQTVNTVVTNTINQAASIATLQSGKQTRPAEDTCPAYKQCLLVEGTDGKPHWYEIITSRLPDGYTELEYIESTGTQWIDTNVPVTDDISWEGRLLSKNDTDKATSIFGYRWTETPTATGNMRFVFLYPNGAFAVRFGVNASQSNLVMSGSEVITLKYENDKFYANGNLFFTETDKNHDGEAQSGYLFNANALYNVDIIPSKMKLYYFKMWDNGTLVRDFVPAKNSSGIIGMYDLVSGEFFTNQGTGTFIGGQPVFN